VADLRSPGQLSNAEFPGLVRFDGAQFTGGEVDFGGAQFTGGEVDFAKAKSWSHPPLFDWKGTPPVGVKLPAGIGGEAQ
jgi:hypothetical protein